MICTYTANHYITSAVLKHFLLVANLNLISNTAMHLVALTFFDYFHELFKNTGNREYKR